ncbi:MAG: DUF4097 family beta strand repeat-containing protein [Methanomassiliicoccales archaeon]
MSLTGPERDTFLLIVVIAVCIVIIASVVLVIFLLPMQDVNIRERRNVEAVGEVDRLSLDLEGDVVSVAVSFDELDDHLLRMEVTARGGVNVLTDPGEALDLEFDYRLEDGVAHVTSTVHGSTGGWSFSWADFDCVVVVDDELATGLDITTSTGDVGVEVPSGVVMDAMSIMSTTGDISIELGPEAVLAGDVSLRATTGEVSLTMSELELRGPVTVDLDSTTGGIHWTLIQTVRMGHDMQVSLSATTGEVDLLMDIHGNGARIESSTTTGEIKADRWIGFLGELQDMRSENYPTPGDVEVDIGTSTGDITIDAGWTPTPLTSA